MTVGLFVPCFIDQYYPHVAIATIDVLEKYGCAVEVPTGQTCCGQPLANAGYASATGDVEDRFVDLFAGYDYVVTPSASCALHVKDHYSKRAQETGKKTFELSQFLHDVLKIQSVDATLKRRIGVHSGCHGLRGLRMGPSTERMDDRPDVLRSLLGLVSGVEIVDLNRPDECCGFGGTFSVGEEAVSVKMGKDRLADHVGAEAEIIVSADMSCLMHLQGIATKQKNPIRFHHIAEVLNGSVN